MPSIAFISRHAPTAATMAAMRRRELKTCRICGKVWLALPSAKTCSNACRQRLKRQKKVYKSSA